MRTLRLTLRRASVVAIAFGLAVVPMVGTLAVLAYAALAERRRPYRHALWLLPVGVLGGVALLLAPPATRALVPWLGWLAIGTAFVLLAQRWSRADARDAGFALAVAAPVLLGWELVQRVGLGIVRPLAFTSHPNFLAGLLVALLGTLATVAALQRTRWVTRLLAVAAAPALIGLFMTASRGGMLGLLAGLLVWLAFNLSRVRWRRLLAWTLSVLAVLAVIVVTLASPRVMRGTNLIQVSGFERPSAPWVLGPGTSIVPAAGPGNGVGGKAVRLVHDTKAYGLVLRYRPWLRVKPGERLTLSLWVRPADSTTRTFVRMGAHTADGKFLARVSRTQWTREDEGTAGGYLLLPNGPAGRWQRVTYVLPPVPQDARWVTLYVACAPGTTGTYGDVDAIQLERGTTATAYVPGPNPTVQDFVDPVLRRWAKLTQPVVASGGRLTMWRFGLQQAGKRPLIGYGPGSEVAIVRQYDATHTPLPLDQLHNFYLEILVQGGALTLLALLAWLGVTLWGLFRRARAGSAASAAALATLVALMVHSVVDPVLAHHYIAGVMWLAVCSGLYGDESEKAQLQPDAT